MKTQWLFNRLGADERLSKEKNQWEEMLVKAPETEMKGEWPGNTEGQGWGVGSLACVSRTLKAEMKE